MSNTENRSSNTEMVSVPRDEVERLVKLLAYQAHPYPSPHAEYWQGILDAPAEPHQGEPVALPDRDAMQRAYTACKYHAPHIFEAGWNALRDEIAKLGPLYARPAPAVQGEPVACSHEWTDDGEFLLVCTKRGTQENHDPKWRDMATAPRDGTLVRLLVEFTEHATEDSDAMPSPTIGANSFDHTGEDVWQFAGWSWEQDCFTQGAGEPVGWLPMLDTPRADPGEVERLRRLVDAKECERQQHLEECAAEVSALRAQLAERDALLEDWHTANCTGEVNVSDKAYRIVTRTAAMLNASAEPSAPAFSNNLTWPETVKVQISAEEMQRIGLAEPSAPVEVEPVEIAVFNDPLYNAESDARNASSLLEEVLEWFDDGVGRSHAEFNLMRKIGAWLGRSVPSVDGGSDECAHSYANKVGCPECGEEFGAEPSPPKCRYCGDTGQIMVGRSGDASDGNAPVLEPCEDCERGAPVERMSAIRSEAAELSSKLKNACCQSCMSNPCDCAIQSARTEIDEQPEFVKTITAKLQRFLDCAEDGQGADIGREWFDVLTKLGLLRRIQRSPAWWEVTEQGDALLARAALEHKS